MSLYARSDLCHISIPATSGGCGGSHSRPVTNGSPAKVWRLDCLPCESYLRGDRKPKIIKVIPGDRDAGIPNRMEHVADSDPHWSSTPEGIPPTPDEQHVNKIRAERGAQELQQLQALIAAKNAGINIPDNAMWLLQQTFDPRIIKGQVVCANGHENVTGSAFCGSCGIRMAAEDPIMQIGDPDGQEIDISVDDGGHIRADALPLRTLHVATLRKMAREKGLPDRGTKDELVKRLQGD